jgi:diacylglycerol kinase (ATP)
VAKPRHSIIQSFNYAFEGVIYALRSERNMRIHFALATGVLVLAFVYGVSKFELIALLIVIALVLITEMINTAIESALDLTTPSFDPLAKIAKDMAAGAVLVSTVTAVVVGYLVFEDKLGGPSYRLLTTIREAPLRVTVIALVLTILIVIAVKALTGRGTPLRGGLPSGHAALAFGTWMAITFITQDFEYRVLVSSLTFALALLVAQTRVESGVHSSVEVLTGAVLGTLVSMMLFQVLG